MVKVALVYDCRAELLMDAFACPAVYTQQQQLTYIGVECSVRADDTLVFLFSRIKWKIRVHLGYSARGSPITAEGVIPTMSFQ